LYASNWRQLRSCGGVKTTDRRTVRDDMTWETAIVHSPLHVPSQPSILFQPAVYHVWQLSSSNGIHRRMRVRGDRYLSVSVIDSWMTWYPQEMTKR